MEDRQRVSKSSVAALISFYDCNGDGEWDIEEFKQMIVPCESGELLRKVQSRPYKRTLAKGEKLENL